MVGGIRRSVVVRAPIEAVWRAVTEDLAAWFGEEAGIEALPGGQLVVREDGRLRRAVVVDVDPPRQLVFRWLPDHHPVGFLWEPDETPAGVSGEVELTLEVAPDGTRVTVVERPPRPARVAGAPGALARG